MATLNRQRIRIAGDAISFDRPNDKIRNAAPAFWRSNDIQFELALFDGSVLLDISNLDNLTVDIRLAGENGGAPDSSVTPAMSKNLDSTSLNPSLLLANWDAGTDQHAAISFTGAESNVAAGLYWLSVWGVTTDVPGRTITYAAGVIKVIEDGAGLSTSPTPPTDTFYNTMQSDARYLQLTNNLSELADLPTSRANLGLGSAATANTGTTTGDVAVVDGVGKLAASIIPAPGWSDITGKPTTFAPSAHTHVEADITDLAVAGSVGGPPLRALKTADQVVNNSTVPVDITDLEINVKAGEKWIFKYFIYGTSSGTAHYRFAFSFPSGTVFDWQVSNVVQTVKEGSSIATQGQTSGVNWTAWAMGMVIDAGVHTITTDGVIALQFAQNAARVGDTTIRDGGFVLAWRVA